MGHQHQADLVAGRQGIEIGQPQFLHPLKHRLRPPGSRREAVIDEQDGSGAALADDAAGATFGGAPVKGGTEHGQGDAADQQSADQQEQQLIQEEPAAALGEHFKQEPHRPPIHLLDFPPVQQVNDDGSRNSRQAPPEQRIKELDHLQASARISTVKSSSSVQQVSICTPQA